MKIIFAITIILIPMLSFADPISCNLSSNDEINVSMSIPHPEHALVKRPNGEIVWLQTSPKFIHKQIEDFGNLATWVVNTESKGTVWVNGKAMIQPILNGAGKYHLYIAENTETELENTYYIECSFTLGKDISK